MCDGGSPGPYVFLPVDGAGLWQALRTDDGLAFLQEPVLEVFRWLDGSFRGLLLLRLRTLLRDSLLEHLGQLVRLLVARRDSLGARGPYPLGSGARASMIELAQDLGSSIFL